MKRIIYDQEGHAHFVTFSCCKRQRMLDHDKAKEIVLSSLASLLADKQGNCYGFVIMPNHVHALLHFKEPNSLSRFMQQWKRLSSYSLKRFLSEHLSHYARHLDLQKGVWTPKYYGFNIYATEKAEEKLTYMHANPVRAGFVEDVSDWRFSSARWYERGENVGVPIN